MSSIKEYAFSTIESNTENNDLCHIDQIQYSFCREHLTSFEGIFIPVIRDVLEFYKKDSNKQLCNIHTMKQVISCPDLLPKKSMLLLFPGTILKAKSGWLFVPGIVYYKFSKDQYKVGVRKYLWLHKPLDTTMYAALY